MFDDRSAHDRYTFETYGGRGRRNIGRPQDVTGAMKRDTSGLLAITLRTGLLVGIAVILILVLLPAALGAQAAGLR